MSARDTPNAFVFTQAQLDALSTKATNGSVVSGNASFEPQDPQVTAALEARRIGDFLAADPPYRRTQSVAGSRRSMAQQIRDFDLAFNTTPRRATR